MATLRQIAALGAAFKSELDKLDQLRGLRQKAQEDIASINARITEQQAIVDKAQVDLKAALA
jgi:uncharacterized coiled-coil protein SlyX